MSTRVVNSSFVNVPADRVWRELSSFKFSFFKDVIHVSAKDGHGVGSLRKIIYNNGWQTVRVAEVSDRTRTISWELVESEPAARVSGSVHTISLASVTTSNGTFVEYTTQLSSDASAAVIEMVRWNQLDLLKSLENIRPSAPVAAPTASNPLMHHVVPENPPVVSLEVQEAFSKLTSQEKKYAHYFGLASWKGSPIVLEQTSVESPAIFQLLLKVVKFASDLDKLKAAAMDAKEQKQPVSNDDFRQFLEYAAVFFANMGNYLGFGDSKFVPRLSQQAFRTICLASASPIASSHTDQERSTQATQVQALLDKWIDAIYSLKPHELILGLPGHGVSTYYSPNITQADIDIVSEWMTSINMSPYNTRLWKHPDGTLELKKASAVAHPPKTHQYKNVKIVESTGDHSPFMAAVVENLSEAKKYAANDTQRQMIDAYVAHFKDGDMKDFAQSQLHWVKDQGPVVETNIGFIESYRDPAGSRGEWEGFCAVVNKETSRKFGELVTQAPNLLKKLPWPKEFEKDEFKRPDFTALEVIAFAGSGIPAGINIPNLDDIRQVHGFKNVSLQNVLSARPPTRPVTFLTPEDGKLFQALLSPAFEVQVGNHELLGHGSGKILQQNADGTFNFDIKNVKNPLTGQPLTTFYKPGETYDTVFGAMSSSLEECRAELVGLLLSADKGVLSVFGHDGKEQDDITYINWLNMARAGVIGLEFYSADKKKWMQAHMQCRYSILRCLLNAGLVTLDITKDDAIVRLDRTKILTVGVPAVKDYLMKIQIFKSSADFKSAEKLYNEMCAVDERFLHLRSLVLEKKRPRPMFVQVQTKINSVGEVELVQFPATVEGLVQSAASRF